MNATQGAMADVRHWQNQQRRVKALRDCANKLDQASREMHATADQIEEGLRSEAAE